MRVAWKVPDSPFRMEPNVAGAPRPRRRHAGRLRGRLRRRAQRDLVERGVGARGRAGARRLDRRASTAPLRGSCRTRALRVDRRSGSPCRACQCSTGSACCTSCGVPSSRDTPPECSAADNIKSLAAILADRAARPRRRRPRAGVKIGLFLALFHDRSLDEALDAARAAGCEAVEIATTGPHDAPDLAAAGRAATASRSPRSPATATRSTPTRRSRAQADRELSPHRGARGRASRRWHGDHILRLPRRVGALSPTELGRRAPGRTTTRRRSTGSGASASSRTGSRRRSSRASTACGSRSSRIPASSSTTPRRCCGCATPRGPSIGVNFDPSHLFWQQIDPSASARSADGCDLPRPRKGHRLRREPAGPRRRPRDEDATPASERGASASIGDGHPVEFWRDLVAALRDAGYDGALSIEHEDPFCSPADGLARAVATLRAALA